MNSKMLQKNYVKKIEKISPDFNVVLLIYFLLDIAFFFQTNKLVVAYNNMIN